MVTHDEDYLLWPYESRLPVVPRESAAERYYEEIAPLREPRGQHSWLHPRGMAPRPDITVSDWHCELIGTWMATASLMAYDADDDRLLEKVQRLLSQWLVAQGPDGYLGTYSVADRWKSWDLWTEAHCMLGLLVYYNLSGQTPALDSARSG